MKTSRQRILEYIQAQRAVTIGELSDVFHTTEANIRHHLSILIQSEQIAVVGERPAAGRGRPAQLFGPPQHSLGDNLDLLVDALLSEIEAGLPAETQQRLIKRVSERFSARIQGGAATSEGGAATSEGGAADPDPHPGRQSKPATRTAPTPLRLIQAVQQLNEHHYQAHWEARPDSPRVILGHCPFAAIIDGHPWLCLVDAHVLKNLLGLPLEQIAKLVPDGPVNRNCIFRLQKE